MNWDFDRLVAAGAKVEMRHLAPRRGCCPGDEIGAITITVTMQGAAGPISAAFGYFDGMPHEEREARMRELWATLDGKLKAEGYFPENINAPA